MKKALALVVIGLAVPSGVCGQAETKMKLNCQQNLDDGRILVTDGRLLPSTGRYKVESYEPTRSDNGWSYGPCVFVFTNPAPSR